MKQGNREVVITVAIVLGVFAVISGFIFGYTHANQQNEPHRIISGAVCGADELANDFLATACAEAKSACGSGCSVWAEAEPINLATVAAEQLTATPDPFSLDGE